ncbi:MAG TPA: NAD(P)H-dependent glycerol-3-phosphate dehydrogenase [Methylophilaceae bacterium]|nr:NAD(P)H-dependent glycerol-3-phosphate dehydrogenase [Methylophilaceae bacterium]
MKIAVLGAGAWGTALAMQISRRNPVVLWSRNSQHVTEMAHARCNAKYLGKYTFNDNVSLVADLSAAVRDADLILCVVPTSGGRALLKEIKAFAPGTPLLWASKGLEPDTSQLPHEVLHEELGEITSSWGILSGPSFADELARGLPTAVTLASPDENFARQAAAMLHEGNLRVYTSADVIGVSVGGALKNVMAIAAGICDGMEFGNNARAALISRGLAEMTRFGVCLGGKRETFMGLAGAGDLILTCTGEYSRNRDVGLRLAGGQTLTQILQSLGHVAEGVYTTREVMRRARELKVDMPITCEVDQVLSDGQSPRKALEHLLSREQKAEAV